MAFAPIISFGFLTLVQDDVFLQVEALDVGPFEE